MILDRAIIISDIEEDIITAVCEEFSWEFEELSRRPKNLSDLLDIMNSHAPQGYYFGVRPFPTKETFDLYSKSFGYWNNNQNGGN